MKEIIEKILKTIVGDQLDSTTTLVVISVVSVISGFIGQWLLKGLFRLYEKISYGKWTITVKNGESGKNWKTKVDIEIIKNFKKKNYVAFKQNLGTLLSGEGHLKFSFGVDINEPQVKRNPPQALGLTIDEKQKHIEVDFSKVPKKESK